MACFWVSFSFNSTRPSFVSKQSDWPIDFDSFGYHFCIEGAVLPSGQLHTAAVNDALIDGDSLLLLYRHGHGVHTLT